MPSKQPRKQTKRREREHRSSQRGLEEDRRDPSGGDGADVEATGFLQGNENVP